MAKRLSILVLSAVLSITATGFLLVAQAKPANANHIPYAIGEVFAGVGAGRINRYTPTGTLIEQLDTTSNSSEETGMCFDGNTPAANLRTTNFSVNNMTRLDNQGGVVTHPWGTGFNSHPESCVVSTSGHIYVGQADGSRDILKFDAAGTLVASYNVATSPRGSDWIDLSADQCTMLYTSEGNLIRRFDVCTNTQLSNFTPVGLPASPCYALRIRANGEVLVACSSSVLRLDAAGTVLQTYPKSVTETSFLFALNIDPNGTDFWTGGYASKRIYRYDIATGVILTQFAATGGTQGPTLAGLAVFGEPVVSLPPTIGPPATLTMDPPAATNTVGTKHCVTATVKDATGKPTPGINVVFSVTGANPVPNTVVTTDSNGQATFCYVGTIAGSDVISAFADTNKNGAQDVGEPGGKSLKEWLAGPPATLTLSPRSAVNPVDTQHCVTATVKDSFGNPVSGVVVRFTVSGSVNTSGSVTTNSKGQATFCYQGPALPGADVIRAFADTNNNGTQDPGEPSDMATKEWVLPVSTPLCEIKITNGGWIIANNGDRANFGGNAKSDGLGTTSGVEEYQDSGPAMPFNLHGNVLAILCGMDGKSGSIYGQATINGTGSHFYRINVIDNGEPGTSDHYWMLIDTGYNSGDHTLMGGNVQVHKG